MAEENANKTSDNLIIEQAALNLLSSVFADKKPDVKAFEGVAWCQVFEELKAQAVAAVPVDILAGVITDSALLNKWFTYAARVMTYGENILYAQSELTELLETNNIPLAILKGSAVSCYYPNPMYRSMGDIDFLVENEDFEKAYKLMTDNGYELAYPIDHVDYHVTFKKGKIMYELHREPAGLTNNAKSDILRKALKGQCRNAVKVDICGYKFYRLPRLYNGLVLLLHIVKHIDDGLGLRQICDWLAFVNSELNNDVWEQEFRPLLSKAGLEQLALIVTRMCKLYLGLSQEITWCDTANRHYCAEFMEFVLANGNFGRKNDKNVRTMAYIGRTKETGNKKLLFSFLIGLQKTGKKRWKLCKKIKILTCVAWAYVPMMYLSKLITGKTKLSETVEMFKAVRDKRNIQDKLSIYE